PGFRAEFRFHPSAFQDFSALRPELSGSRAPTLPLVVERPTQHPRSCLTTLTAFSPPPSSLLRCRPGGLVTVSLPRPARLLRPPPPPEHRLANLLLADRSHPLHRFQRLGRGYAKFLRPSRAGFPLAPNGDMLSLSSKGRLNQGRLNRKYRLAPLSCRNEGNHALKDGHWS